MKKLLFFLSLFICSISFAQRNKTEANVSGRFYYVKDYGAKGDSSTDDRAAIIRCFTAAKADSSAIVFFGDGRYVISDSIVVPTGLTIWGTSSGKNTVTSPGSLKYPTGSVIIVNSQTHIGFVINSNGVQGNTGPARPVTIEKLSFLNTSASTPTSASAGIMVREFAQFTLRDLQIQGFYINLNVVSGDYWTADNCRFADAVQYQMSVADQLAPDAGDMFINNCLFETLLTRQPRAGIYYHSGGGMKITNCKFNKWDSDDNNRSIYGIIVEMDQVTSDFLINNCSIENFDSTGIYIHQVGSTAFYNMLMDNVQIATSVAKGSPIKILGGGSGDFGVVTLSNYTVTDYGTNNNSNAWLSLTNVNYINVGIGTARYYAPYSISGGGNIGTIYDAITKRWIVPSFTDNSTLQVGSLEFQTYAVNNAWMGDNAYFNGTNFVRRAAGYGQFIYFSSGEIRYHMSATSTAGSTITAIIPFKINVDKTVAIGGDITGTPASYTGASMTVDATTISHNISEAHKYRGITALRTLDATDYLVNCTANSFTVTLPTAVGITGRQYIIKNTGSSTTITIATTSSQTIDGASPGTITTTVPLRVMSDGANWITF